MIKFGSDEKLDYAPFLMKTEETDGTLRFVVTLSKKEKVDPDEVSEDYLKDILKNAYSLIPDSENVYEIIFESYILYQVRNESYCSFDSYEKGEGYYFIIFEKSRLLDILPVITDCQILSDGSCYPDKWKHYGIYCHDHIADIISCDEPVVRKIQS